MFLYAPPPQRNDICSFIEVDVIHRTTGSPNKFGWNLIDHLTRLTISFTFDRSASAYQFLFGRPDTYYPRSGFDPKSVPDPFRK